MAKLTIELPALVYAKLKKEAQQLGKSPQSLAQEWVAKHLENPALPEQGEWEKVRDILATAGLLTELGPNLQKMADPAISLKEVQSFLGTASGKTLSEIVIEQREQAV